ncbi:MAG: 50S ribosomal protein L4 [Nanoarchaeota archaeon]
MTKAQILDINGNKTKEITTALFEEPIREDIIYKIVEAEKIKQGYANKLYSGMNRSASGNITHRRHVWGTDRGKGIPRIPRKVFWRRGTQFSWQGAIIPSVRGGRRAHPPRAIFRIKKINKKVMKKAILSALTYSNSVEGLNRKYSTLKDKKLSVKLPLIVEDKILTLKTKQFFESLGKILGELKSVAIKRKSIRAGIGKLRGRRYKQNAGMLFILGRDENKKIKGIDVINTNELTVSDLADNGSRLIMFTEKAIKDLEANLL